MSRNATGLKSSSSRRPVQTLRSLGPTEEVQKPAEPYRMRDSVRGIRGLILRLLREVDVLEHDELFAEMATLPTFQRLDVEQGIKFDDVVRQFETNLIRQALFVTNGNQARAAKMLGIKPNTLNYKIKVLKL
jgi:DNA-binding NtrC family response regulator